MVEARAAGFDFPHDILPAKLEDEHVMRRMSLARDELATLGCRDNFLANGKLHQIRIGLETEVFHDPILVERDSPRSYMQRLGNLLHGSAFGKQLQDLPLTRRQSLLVIGPRITHEFVLQA